MKKASILGVVFFFLFVLIGCDIQETSYYSRPVGYSLISDTYVAEGSFRYDSTQPNNVNEISLVLYYLPSVWGEIEIAEDEQISETDPNFIILDFNTENQKVFAKYIHIGENSWTAENNEGQIRYVDENGDDILELLADEDEAKTYVEALKMHNVYFLDNEMAMLTGYLSKLDIVGADQVIQRITVSQMIMISYNETLTSFPDLSSHFSNYDSEEINTLFQRALDKAEQAEYRTSFSVG